MYTFDDMHFTPFCSRSGWRGSGIIRVRMRRFMHASPVTATRHTRNRPDGKPVFNLPILHAMTFHSTVTNPGDVFDLQYEEFDSRVIAPSHDTPILVDLWADWCSPCIVLAPVLLNLVSECNGSIRLAKVEVDEGENMKLAGHYRVRGFPTVILFRDGEEKDRFHGAKPLHFLREFVGPYIDIH